MGWGTFSQCSIDCGGGKQHRTRTIAKQRTGNGIKCPLLKETRHCNTQGCTPQNCQAGDWGGYGKCNKACGGGKQTRSRPVTVPAKHGGLKCGKLQEHRECNTQSCPKKKDCAVGEWSEFTQCSRNCGGGEEVRKRKVKHLAEHGGRTCPTLKEVRTCNSQPC